MTWNHTWLQENRKSQRSWNGPSKGRRCGRAVVEKMIIMAILLAVIWLLSPSQNGHSSFSMASWHRMHYVTCRNHLTGGSRARFKSLLFTITASGGLIWIPKHSRWLTASETLLAMGFPVQPSHVAAAGASCQYSATNASSCPHRSRHSTKMAAGNAMHVNAVGAALAAAICTVPDIMSISSAELATRAGRGIKRQSSA